MTTCISLGSTSEVSVFYAIDPDPSAAVPATQSWQGVRMTGETLDANLTSTISNEITAQRSFSNSILTQGQSVGGFNFEATYTVDDFLVSVLQANKGLDVAAVKASLATGVVGNDNAITWTAENAGTGGNSVTVTLTDPSGADQALSVGVSTNDIDVSLATNGASAITSTAAEVIAAVIASDAANALVDVVNTTTSDGSGTMVAESQASLTGGTAVTNPWATTEYIQNGSTKFCLMFLKRINVGGTNYDYVYRGCQIDSLSMNMEPGQIVTGQVTLMGTSVELPAAAATDEWTFTSADLTKPLMSSVDSIKNFALTDSSDSSIAVTFQSLSLTFSNQMRQQNAIGTGSIYAAGVGSGRFMAELSASVYFANTALYTALIADDYVKLSFDMQDSEGSVGNKFNFNMDFIKVQGGVTPLAGGPDQDLIMNPTFRAFEDTTIGTVRITRTDYTP